MNGTKPLHADGPSRCSPTQPVRNDRSVASIQTTDEIRDLLSKLKGERFATLQVLGINSLKSRSPMPDALAGEQITAIAAGERAFTLETSDHKIDVDLQRTGRLVWLAAAVPYAVAAGESRPTIRVVLASGAGLDLIEPAKTKRITVTISVK